MRKTRPQTRLSRSLAFAAGFGAACAAAIAVTPSAALAGACDTYLPVSGEFSSGFGYRGRGFHPGVDIRAPYGSPIHAARAGRVVYAGGAVTTLDERALRAEARALAATRRAALDAAAALVEPLRPAYREMYLRAAARDVGMTRWVGEDPC